MFRVVKKNPKQEELLPAIEEDEEVETEEDAEGLGAGKRGLKVANRDESPEARLLSSDYVDSAHVAGSSNLERRQGPPARHIITVSEELSNHVIMKTTIELLDDLVERRSTSQRGPLCVGDWEERNSWSEQRDDRSDYDSQFSTVSWGYNCGSKRADLETEIQFPFDEDDGGYGSDGIREILGDYEPAALPAGKSVHFKEPVSDLALKHSLSERTTTLDEDEDDDDDDDDEDDASYYSDEGSSVASMPPSDMPPFIEAVDSFSFAALNAVSCIFQRT